MRNNQPLTIGDLYPGLTDEEARIAEANVRRYVEIVWRIHERLKAEGRQWPGLEAGSATNSGSLTVRPGSHNIIQRSNPPQ
ncbi:MAG: hypothetical protein ABSG25_05380 [Bryobacteraceae bacterium]